MESNGQTFSTMRCFIYNVTIRYPYAIFNLTLHFQNPDHLC